MQLWKRKKGSSIRKRCGQVQGEQQSATLVATSGRHGGNSGRFCEWQDPVEGEGHRHLFEFVDMVCLVVIARETETTDASVTNVVHNSHRRDSPHVRFKQNSRNSECHHHDICHYTLR